MKMAQYKTIYNEIYDLGDLSSKEKCFLRKVKKNYDKSPEWIDFSNYWKQGVENLFKGSSGKEITKNPVYRVCEDLEGRLGIKQGYIRSADYRDMLEELIDSQYSSRYQFCKKNKFREDLISRVLNKKRDLSLEMLQKILKPLHYEICFREVSPKEKVILKI